MRVERELGLYEKLNILSDAAKYDVACTSSGVDRAGSGRGIGNCIAPGICHTFSADGRCISLLKILLSNDCVFDCRYCINRVSNDVERATFTAEEVCMLTMEFYRRNYIEGLFLSSGVFRTPAYTMERIYETVLLLRTRYHFEGYIHVKMIPGAPQDMIEAVGFLADRMSINMELPTSESLRLLAPHKTRKRILEPMRRVQLLRNASRLELGLSDGRSAAGTAGMYGRLEHGGGAGSSGARQVSAGDGRAAMSGNGTAEFSEEGLDLSAAGLAQRPELLTPDSRIVRHGRTGVGAHASKPQFVPAGQSTQMIVGATPESDYQIIQVAEALYRRFELKRVFYSAFIRVNDDPILPVLPGGPPLLREHRLYQADWLLRYYGFEAKELLSEQHPNFNVFLDPKCDWALSHLEYFPVEVGRADYQTLLRVPGIGPRSAQRIVRARRMGKLDYASLKKMGVVLKRAVYFITCEGRQMYQLRMNEDFILRNLLQTGEKRGPAETATYRQLSLFDDCSIRESSA